MAISDPLDLLAQHVLLRLLAHGRWFPTRDRDIPAAGDAEITARLDLLEFNRLVSSGLGYGLAPRPGTLMRYYEITTTGRVIAKTLFFGSDSHACTNCGSTDVRWSDLSVTCVHCGCDVLMTPVLPALT